MRRAPWLPVLLVLTACGFKAWMMYGIRYTNHDDLFFMALASNPDISVVEAALWVAGFGQRLAHLFNTVLALVGLRLAAPPFWGDVAILAQLAAILICFGFLLWRAVGSAAACGLVMMLAGGYALHWYFMPPLAYPLLGLNAVMLLGVSLLGLERRMAGGTRLWLAASLTAFAIGTLWPEYNLLLFPGFLFIAILLLEPHWPRRLRLAWPYCAIWLGGALASVAFHALFPSNGDEARMTVSLAPLAFIQTMGILLRNSLLPFAAFGGVAMYPLSSPGAPPFPLRLDVGFLWQVMRAAPVGFAAVLGCWWAAFAAILARLEPRPKELLLVTAAGAVFLLLPVAVVSLSSHYQSIVREGHLQGALVSAYAQAGYLTLVFGGVAYLVVHGVRQIGRFLLAGLLAALCTLTLAYDLVSRDAMAANQQRWQGFNLMAEALPEGTRLHAPVLWERAGVSAIPGNLPFGMANYWTEYARHQLGRDIRVEAGASPSDGAARASLGLRHDGWPLVLLRQEGQAELLARHPVSLPSWAEAGEHWQCTPRFCRKALALMPDAEGEAALLTPPSGRRPGMIGWLLVPRRGGIGWR